MSVFYDHLLELSELDRELEDLALEYHEKAHLLEMVDSSLHHAVMDVILSELPNHVHDEFVQKFSVSPHDPEHFKFLGVYIPQVEEKIKTRAKQTKAKFKEEIRKVKTSKKN